MKKVIGCILAVVLVFSLNPFVYAEEDSGYDFSEWTDEQLLYLLSQVEEEIDRRGLKKPKESLVKSLEPAPAPAISVTASELKQAFRDNEISANKAYKGKTIEVTGAIFNMLSLSYKYTVSLGDADIVCNFAFNEKNEDDLDQLNKGDLVTIRGTYLGGDRVTIHLEDCEVVK